MRYYLCSPRLKVMEIELRECEREIKEGNYNFSASPVKLLIAIPRAKQHGKESREHDVQSFC